jgi:hypothetical protein
VEELYYDEKGKLMRRFDFRDIQVMDGRKIPTVMELVPQTEQGHRTVLRYLEVDFNRDVRDQVFSLRHLRSSQ